MKLTPAEEIIKRWFDGIEFDPNSWLELQKSDLVEKIRQIQADALRWASTLPDAVETDNIKAYNLACELRDSLLDKANQLHPLPKRKYSSPEAIRDVIGVQGGPPPERPSICPKCGSIYCRCKPQ